MIIHVKLGKDKRQLDVAHNATLAQVASLIALTFEGDLSVSSLTLLFKGRAFKPGSSKRDADTILHNAGIRERATLMALGNSSKVVQQAIDSSADDPLMRGIEEELAMVAKRRRPARVAPTIPTGPYTFQKYYALPAHELEGAYPPPRKALELLHRLAADPGIVGIMQQNQFAVGCLSEMPPQNFMDDTRAVTCLLGLNINRGQEIKLRLRTNDLKGFRNYERIRETLVHELTHNVWGDHGNNFKELNSKLLRECVRINRTRDAAQTVLGDAEVRDEQEPAPATAPVSHVVGGQANSGFSAAQAAAAAAARRQAVLAAQRDAAVALDVTRAYEQAADCETQAEEDALAAWGSLGAPAAVAEGPEGACSSPSAGGAAAATDAAVPQAAAAPMKAMPHGGGPSPDEPMSAEPGAGVEGSTMSAVAEASADADGDAAMRGAENTPQMPSEAVHEMVQSIGNMLRRQHAVGAVVALRTVQQILRNAAEKEEPKYRRIRRQNELYAVRVAPFPEAEALLTVAGFELQDDVWTLPAQHSSLTLARVHEEVAQVLQSCQ
eukprot:jgi/Ulvmu1/3023/UM015_0063.1